MPSCSSVDWIGGNRIEVMWASHIMNENVIYQLTFTINLSVLMSLAVLPEMAMISTELRTDM